MTTLIKAGRYEITGELGRGTMGVVYKAVDPVIGRTVAVKTIRLSEEGTGMTREELIARFQTEARAAGLLTHPNIVVVYDAGEEEGLFYITMELVEGRSLQALLDHRQSFPLPRVLRILEQTGSALQFAHERNVVHRDIKPANLMLTDDDTVKVTDFGTAKILQFGTTQQTAHVIGTPSYMSPEQVKGRAVDGRSDIFSLGVVFYEMMTGEKPFPGQNITTVIYKIVNEDPIPPRQLDPSIHPGLNNIITRALAKEPDARYQSCRELLEDLRNYRELGGNTEATMVLPGRPAAGARTMETTAAGASTMRLPQVATPRSTTSSGRISYVNPPVPKPRKRAPEILFAVILLALIGYCGYRLRPYMEDLWQRMQANRAAAAPRPAATALPTSAELSNAKGTSPAHPEDSDRPASPPGNPAPPENKASLPTSSNSAAPSEKPAPVHKAEPALTPAAAGVKGRIEQGLAQEGIADKVKAGGSGNTLTLSGRLRPRQHRELLKYLRETPADVHIVDDIEYDDSAEGTGADGNPADATPAPARGKGAIEVSSDVPGATAVLRGPGGRAMAQCQTPCRFTELSAARFNLEVAKDGYKSVQTALQVQPGETIQQRIQLEATALGLLVKSRPSGADVFIDGTKQSGQTPVTLPLAPGQYNLVLRKAGYEPYAGQVQVKANIQTQLDAELAVKSERLAWAMVRTQPRGAEIFVDGNSTGQFSPARVRMTPGQHSVTMVLKGFAPVTRAIAVDEGQTVQVLENLRFQ